MSFRKWVLAALIAGVSTPAIADSFDWRKFSGETITVSMAKQPWSDYIVPLLPQFEELTGIKARVEVLPEDQNRQKLAIAFASGRGDIDVFASQRHQEGAKYRAAGWYVSLNDRVADPTRTAADFDFSDFLPQAVNDATINGDIVGIPLYSELEVMAYRKDLLKAAGLGVPQTLDELEAAAKALNDPSTGTYGICLRGKGAATTTIFSGILHSMGGSWVGKDGRAALDTPEAIHALEYYGRLAREAGPLGIENFHWLQCQNLMSSGRAAFWLDSNIFYASLLDPAKSQVADKVGFAVLPAGPAGHKPAGGGWYLSINSKSAKADAAWYFIQWAINKSNTLGAQLAGIPTGRLSAWSSPEFAGTDVAPELTQATLESLKLENTPSWGPPFVSVGEVRDVIGALVVSAIQGNSDLEAAAHKAVTEVEAIRTKTE
ncbi:sugar ABC transporter substrate-binding protein [Shinella sp.]|uniref:ABC transporter substrate-binding protein n=1 Tax=Shinella sp. TaxID=1870904 RepID=UPI0028A1045D|nr:sugar ABC transporter substrate-binding protein [Shinella sp.]